MPARRVNIIIGAEALKNTTVKNLKILHILKIEIP